MADTCTFTSRETPTCPAPATHRVVRAWQQHAWRIEDAPEPRTEIPGATADVQAYGPEQVPEFCLHHAGDVMEQRNRPVRRATP